MHEPGILRLDVYRGRREQRLRLSASLYRADPQRSKIFQSLSRVAALVGADRAATVWIDEYGPGLVHPHVVLDLVSDRPRRALPAEPLRRALEAGVPGVFETQGAGFSRDEGQPWTVAVALGSDGTRSWFLVADAVSPRTRLPDDVRERLLFLAGKCSAVVLHKDLDAMALEEGEGQTPREGRPHFAGWPILQDIEGREDDESESRRIAMRFVVARLPRLLVEDDLAIPRDRLRHQAERAREEVDKDAALMEVGPEADLWADVLDAFQEGELERLGAALLALGGAIEARAHLYGAVELYRVAYDLFAAVGQVAGAVDAARFSGRVLRRLAAWDEAVRWYGIARDVAEAGGLYGKTARVLVGVANLHRERGNIPSARSVLEESLTFAERSGERDALGLVFHGLAEVEHASRNLAQAAGWGWRAVDAYGSREDQVTALATLGATLIDLGDLDSAADAWACTRDLAANDYYRLYALDALGHICALKGDRGGFERWAGDADTLGWESGLLSAKAEILHYRGLSHLALGDTARAREYLERAVSFAEEHRFGQTLFAAEHALRRLDDRMRRDEPPIVPFAPSTAPEEVRAGLRQMRYGLEAGTPA